MIPFKRLQVLYYDILSAGKKGPIERHSLAEQA